MEFRTFEEDLKFDESIEKDIRSQEDPEIEWKIENNFRRKNEKN